MKVHIVISKSCDRCGPSVSLMATSAAPSSDAVAVNERHTRGGCCVETQVVELYVDGPPAVARGGE